MTDTLLKTLESAALGQQTATSEILNAIKFDQQGLIAVIAQQYDTGEVLMLAWMNREALEETLSTKRVCYWSRSRQRFWRKGESSGQVQSLVSAHLDCDGDALLLKVEQQGPACHTGRRSCFYHQLDQQQATISSEPLIDPADLYR